MYWLQNICTIKILKVIRCFHPSHFIWQKFQLKFFCRQPFDKTRCTPSLLKRKPVYLIGQHMGIFVLMAYRASMKMLHLQIRLTRIFWNECKLINHLKVTSNRCYPDFGQVVRFYANFYFIREPLLLGDENIRGIQ